MKRFIPLLLIIMSLVLSSCKSEDKKTSVSFFAMDTYMTIEAYGGDEGAAQKAKERVTELEKLFSVTDENSEIFKLNSAGTAELSPESAELIGFALEMSEKTGGALDPTIYPILREWGFTTGEYRIPNDEEIAELLKNIGADKVHKNENKISLESGVMLDLGAVAKGYAGEECSKILRENCVNSALINLGGNIQLVGNKPDGTPWKIGVADPLDPNNNIGVLSVSDCAAVTSGNYQRYFIEDDVVYGHIIDPETGYPVNNDLLSVTIIADNGELCDALSTALFVMGYEKAERFWREYGNFEAVFVVNDNTVRVTDGIFEKFEINENSEFKVARIS